MSNNLRQLCLPWRHRYPRSVVSNQTPAFTKKNADVHARLHVFSCAHALQRFCHQRLKRSPTLHCGELEPPSQRGCDPNAEHHQLGLRLARHIGRCAALRSVLLTADCLWRSGMRSARLAGAKPGAWIRRHTAPRCAWRDRRSQPPARVPAAFLARSAGPRAGPLPEAPSALADAVTRRGQGRSSS